MKVRIFLSLVTLAMIACLGLATAASAEPPKETFEVTWMNGRAGDLDPLDPWCESETGNAIHEHCGSIVFDLVECTNPKVCGTLEWWEAPCNFTPGMMGCHTRVRIDVDEDGYWEGTGSNVMRSRYGEMDVPVARLELRGHGTFDGLLLKGVHWFEPGEPPPFPDDNFKAMLGGEIIVTGRP